MHLQFIFNSRKKTPDQRIINEQSVIIALNLFIVWFLSRQWILILFFRILILFIRIVELCNQPLAFSGDTTGHEHSAFNCLHIPITTFMYWLSPGKRVPPQWDESSIEPCAVTAKRVWYHCICNQWRDGISWEHYVTMQSLSTKNKLCHITVAGG